MVLSEAAPGTLAPGRLIACRPPPNKSEQHGSEYEF